MYTPGLCLTSWITFGKVAESPMWQFLIRWHSKCPWEVSAHSVKTVVGMELTHCGILRQGSFLPLPVSFLGNKECLTGHVLCELSAHLCFPLFLLNSSFKLNLFLSTRSEHRMQICSWLLMTKIAMWKTDAPNNKELERPQAELV